MAAAPGWQPLQHGDWTFPHRIVWLGNRRQTGGSILLGDKGAGGVGFGAEPNAVLVGEVGTGMKYATNAKGTRLI